MDHLAMDPQCLESAVSIGPPLVSVAQTTPNWNLRMRCCLEPSCELMPLYVGLIPYIVKLFNIVHNVRCELFWDGEVFKSGLNECIPTGQISTS